MKRAIIVTACIITASAATAVWHTTPKRHTVLKMTSTSFREIKCMALSLAVLERGNFWNISGNDTAISYSQTEPHPYLKMRHCLNFKYDSASNQMSCDLFDSVRCSPARKACSGGTCHMKHYTFSDAEDFTDAISRLIQDRKKRRNNHDLLDLSDYRPRKYLSWTFIR